MSGTKTLILGIDIDLDYLQLSSFHEKRMEAVSVCLNQGKQEFCIPVCLILNIENKEWLIGWDALKYYQHHGGNLVDDLLLKLCRLETVTVIGKEFTAVDLWERFLRQFFRETRKVFQNETIRKLAITCNHADAFIVEGLTQALGRIGIEKERLVFVSHTQAFMHYVMHQKPDLRKHEIGLFDFSKEKLTYKQLKISNKGATTYVIVQRIPLMQELNVHQMKQMKEEHAGNLFEELAKQVMYQKQVSTLYVTGKGFEGNWSDTALLHLCSGRRVFRGQNLYSNGACYAGYYSVNPMSADYELFDESMVIVGIGLQLYMDAKLQILPLIKAGDQWSESKKRVTVILDGTSEITFHVEHLLKGESSVQVMKLDNLTNRENKTIRICIEIEMRSCATALVTVKDTGFGDFYENSYRIWQQLLYT